MDFSTRVSIPDHSFRISHHDKLLMTGSCFTENVGNFLLNHGFKVSVNPFGIIYNPVSLFNGLKRIIDNELYTTEDLLYFNELYVSLDHHGNFSGMEEIAVLDNINSKLNAAGRQLKDAEYITITLGTSFAYYHKEKQKIVANCHKIPGKEFDKKLLSIAEIVSSFNAIKNSLKAKKIIFTVSPVRHWRDGATENLRSKSILVESIHQIIQENETCFYFPAYEIIMDELRDYRFYAEDMLHPNEVAVKYICKRFSDTYFSSETVSVNREIEKINALLQHRVKNQNTIAEAQFREQVKNTIGEFKIRYPMFDESFFSETSSSNTGNSI
jgi:hypothetical protein